MTKKIALSLLLACTATARAQEPAAHDRLVEQGLSALYNLDYPAARARFREMEESFPGSALGPYAQATALWWELTNEFDEDNPELEKAFLESADRAARLAQALIKEKGDPDGEAHLCLGGAQGLTARWQAIEGQWLAAYRNGRRAFKNQKQAIEINPQMYDAYLGVGIFHYYTATLPAVVKVLAKMMFGGNKQQGLDEIRLVMEKGRFARTAAKLFMVGILVNNDKTPEKALPLVREARREAPGSPFFPLLEMLVLEEAKDWDALEREARAFLERIDKQEPLFGRNHRHRALWSLGNAFLGRGEAAKAEELYNGIMNDSPGRDRWITLTLLNRGRARDRLGRREEAVADYREVLRRRDVWQLHDRARRYLDEPDHGG